MRTLLVIACLTIPVQAVHAQDIYKWEDEKGVIHYGDKPAPGAKPLDKATVPFSTPGGQSETPLPEEPSNSSPRQGPRARVQRTALPSPSLKQPKAWVEYPSGNFWISGTMRNGGRGLCDAPTVEIAVIDELGRANDRFELSAVPNGINKGEDAQFSGNRSGPIGDKLSWEATPRCGSAVGAIYGARKRGSLRIPHSRIVRSKRLKRYRQ
jgi:hypothetical protein